MRPSCVCTCLASVSIEEEYLVTGRVFREKSRNQRKSGDVIAKGSRTLPQIGGALVDGRQVQMVGW